MKLSERLRNAIADVSSNDVDASMTEAADLLDECEKALHNAAIYRENADFTLINDTLARLRGEPLAQENEQ